MDEIENIDGVHYVSSQDNRHTYIIRENKCYSALRENKCFSFLSLLYIFSTIIQIYLAIETDNNNIKILIGLNIFCICINAFIFFFIETTGIKKICYIINSLIISAISCTGIMMLEIKYRNSYLHDEINGIFALTYVESMIITILLCYPYCNN